MALLAGAGRVAIGGASGGFSGDGATLGGSPYRPRRRGLVDGRINSAPDLRSVPTRISYIFGKKALPANLPIHDYYLDEYLNWGGAPVKEPAERFDARLPTGSGMVSSRRSSRAGGKVSSAGGLSEQRLRRGHQPQDAGQLQDEASGRRMQRRLSGQTLKALDDLEEEDEEAARNDKITVSKSRLPPANIGERLRTFVPPHLEDQVKAYANTKMWPAIAAEFEAQNRLPWRKERFPITMHPMLQF